jgi:hypothetical protein
MPLSAIFQLNHGDQFWWWKKPEYLERTTDHGQATIIVTGKEYITVQVDLMVTLIQQSLAVNG